MFVMPSNHSSPAIHYWAGRYREIAWLIGPKSFGKAKLRKWIPYALDNDVFSAFTEKKPWDEYKYFKGLDRARMEAQKPMWAAVPDAVADRKQTLNLWDKYAARVASYGWPLAFVVQDGMTLNDIPQEASIVFVGGSTKFKWSTLNMWLESGKRIHVGRVNSMDRVWLCHDLGVESVDGTGWFRDGDDAKRLLRLETYFKRERPVTTLELFN
jgi:hypothetical protein